MRSDVGLGDRVAVGAFIGVLLLIVLMSIGALCWSGCNPYAVGWRAAAGVKSAGELAEDTLASTIRAKHAECVKKHGAQTYEYAECIKNYRLAAIYWIRYLRPSINAAIRATVTALTIAERVKGKEANWVELLKPAVCALVGILQEWSPLIPPKIQERIRGLLALAKGVTCGN